jgi:hypothetical protein
MLGVIEGLRRGWAHGRAAPDASAPAAGSADYAPEQQTLAEVVALAEALQARVDELEAEREASPAALFAEALRLPGVKTWLLSRFHPDKHPDANEAERGVLTASLQKINAAYETLERGS